MSEAVFKGKSGKLYRFHALKPGAAALPEPAVYVFARTRKQSLEPVYLARTANLALRLERHERWEEARLLGADQVLAWFEPERAARVAAEADLLAALRPVLNPHSLAAAQATVLAFPAATAGAPVGARKADAA